MSTSKNEKSESEYNQYLAAHLDLTLLSAIASPAAIATLCIKAELYKVAAVCVLPYWVPLCRSLLTHSDVKVATVIDFPLGGGADSRKQQIKEAIKSGAQEIDLMAPLPLIKNNRLNKVQEDLTNLKRTARRVPIKLIMETSVLNDSELQSLCWAAAAAKIDILKTSTGTLSSTNTLSEVERIRRYSDMPIKASGGIRMKEQLEELVAMGVVRVGTSQLDILKTNLDNAPIASSDY